MAFLGRKQPVFAFDVMFWTFCLVLLFTACSEVVPGLSALGFWLLAFAFRLYFLSMINI